MTLDLASCSDGELAALSLAGRQNAYGEIMRRHREPLYRLVRSYVGDADEALDITQEAFVAAYRALSRYDPARPLAAWLARIAINKCRDWARRRAVRRFLFFAVPLDDGVTASLADEQPGQERQAAARDEVRRLASAIARLPASLKEPLLLCSVEGLSQREASEILAISEKAVETRLRRARSQLASMIEASDK